MRRQSSRTVYQQVQDRRVAAGSGSMFVSSEMAAEQEMSLDSGTLSIVDRLDAVGLN